MAVKKRRRKKPTKKLTKAQEHEALTERLLTKFERYDIENEDHQRFIGTNDIVKMYVPFVFSTPQSVINAINKEGSYKHFVNEKGFKEKYVLRIKMDKYAIKKSKKQFKQKMFENSYFYDAEKDEGIDITDEIPFDRYERITSEWFDNLATITEKRKKRYVYQDETNSTREVVKMKGDSPYDTYRMYYGLLHFKDFIDKSFMRMKGISKKELELLGAINQFRFFSSNEIYHFAPLGMTTAQEVLKTKGWSKFHSKKGLRGRKIRNANDNSLVIHTITPYAAQLYQEYLDYILFRKKLPRTLHDSEKPELSHWLKKDIKLHSEKEEKEGIEFNRNNVPNRGSYMVYHDRKYVFYSFFFEHVNLYSELVNPLGYSEEELELAMNESSVDYKFSAYFYLMQDKLFSEIGEDYLSKKRTKKIFEAFTMKNAFSDKYKPPPKQNKQ